MQISFWGGASGTKHAGFADIKCDAGRNIRLSMDANNSPNATYLRLLRECMHQRKYDRSDNRATGNCPIENSSQLLFCFNPAPFRKLSSRRYHGAFFR